MPRQLPGKGHDKQIAAEATVLVTASPQTVDTYRSRLMQKLNIENFAGLVRFAIACGLTRP